jgi:membrane protease YdiL (CAAX protease family)
MEFSLFQVVLRVSLVLVAAFFLTIATVAVVKICKIDIKDFKQRTGPKLMGIAFIANLLFIFSVYLLLSWLDGRDIQTLGFSLPLLEFEYSILALLLTLLTAFLFVFGLSPLKNYQVQWNFKEFIRKDEAGTFLLSFIVLFVAALQEEVMFRGYLAFVFQNYRIMSSMALSTIIFTVWHFIGNKVNRYQAMDWFMGGLLLFYVYIESGSVLVAAIIHFSRNLTNVLVFNIAEKHSLLKWNIPITAKHKSLYILSCSLVIALFTTMFY